MSESWEDITGSLEAAPKQSLITPTKKHEYRHESDQVTIERRARSLESIYKILPEAKMNGVMVTAESEGERFDFFPSSDTYYIHSTQKYGSGIQKLCEQIAKDLLKAPLSDRDHTRD